MHRYVYELNYGDIPDGMHVLHSCDNPSCINIDHLRVGTNQDNVDDRTKRNRQAKGARHGRAKLTESQVRKIKYIEEGTLKEIGGKYGVSDVQVCNIKNGKQWGYI